MVVGLISVFFCRSISAVASSYKKSAEMFAALGDETRLQLVAAICEEGPQSIAQLTAGKKITRQAVTKHLETLQEVGLVHSHQSGREKIWDLDKKRLQVAQDYLEMISSQWDRALHRLKMFVEE